MLIMTSKGLYCPAGNFYIDPNSAVENAVITHAHSDHARRGSQHYFCATPGLSLLKARVGKNICVTTKQYGEVFSLGPVTISFHPAGHILGSAQIRLTFAGEVWVVSGDYKRVPDSTCSAFEPLKCDVFITEATFGTPTYIWDKQINIGADIFTWWQENASEGKNSVLFAYSLGKIQRILNLLAPFAKKPIYCDSHTDTINNCYRAENVTLATTLNIENITADADLSGELFIVPPAFSKTKHAIHFGKRYSTAFASGWMKKTSPYFKKGFLLSDHADWNDLIQTILETEAKRIYVQHRGNGALIKKLRAMGLQAFPDSKLLPKNPAQYVLF